MKAVVWTQYGPPEVLQLREVEKPAPKDGEVLIRIRATTVTSGDCEQRNLQLPLMHRLPMQVYVGLRRPQRITILGMELAGEVEAVGKAVTRFQAGDVVFGATGFVGMGTYAEYICLPEEPEAGVLALKPAAMTYEEAAAVPMGGIEALNFLRQGDIQRRQTILINGAGGTIGTFAVQLAKHFGAAVTAVDSTDKLEMLRDLGADQVIDYTQEDFTQRGETYAMILDLVGKRSIAQSIQSLQPDGCYLLANPDAAQMVSGRWASLKRGKKVIFGAAYPKTEDLVFLRELIEAGRLKTVIDRQYPLEDIVEAHRYVETGRKAGHVIITVAHNPLT